MIKFMGVKVMTRSQVGVVMTLCTVSLVMTKYSMEPAMTFLWVVPVTIEFMTFMEITDCMVKMAMTNWYLVQEMITLKEVQATIGSWEVLVPIRCMAAQEMILPITAPLRLEVPQVVD